MKTGLVHGFKVAKSAPFSTVGTSGGRERASPATCSGGQGPADYVRVLASSGPGPVIGGSYVLPNRLGRFLAYLRILESTVDDV